MQEVLDFIRVFQSPSNKILFTETACYWFAKILNERFEYSTIYFNPHTVHFATEINSKLYDISGLIEDEEDEYYDFDLYCQHSSAQDISLIIENCINLKGGE